MLVLARMVDWIAIAITCGLTGVVGLAFVLWERYETERLTRERLRRRIPRRRRPASVGFDRRAA
jgi:hypothetical protein